MESSIVEKLCQALELSLSPNNETRHEAENYVFEAMEWNGFCSATLHIASTPSYNEGRKVDVNQAAAIQFKNMAETHWRFKSETHAKDTLPNGFRFIIIQQEDKQYVHENIMNIILECKNDNVKSQLHYAVECIVRIDYPEKWPGLTEQIKEFINTEDEIQILTGLEALKSIIKRYEFEHDKGREPLDGIVNDLFPRLEQFVELLQNNDSSLAFDIRYRVADLMYRANNISMSQRYNSKEGLERLMNFYKYAIDLPISESLTTPTENSNEIAFRNNKPEWKLKAVSIHFFFRIFQKYGNPEYADDESKDFSNNFGKFVH